MAQLVKVLAAKPVDLKCIPGTYRLFLDFKIHSVAWVYSPKIK